jgi:AmmeMemoRadiSam system radical SAM enzyme/AmmeMemoRadiSam system protein B/AmmeMemoRadiSam system protein A
MREVNLPPITERWADGAASGGWYHEDPLEAKRLICDLCPRACALREGDKGFCFVRENRSGQMVLNTYGKSTGFCIDPIEKKPLNQFYPNTAVLSFGTAGCNLGCKFCQNWSISKSREVEMLSESASPAAIAQAALRLGCESVAFTYNDPVIWAEYAIDTAKACRAVGVKTVAVTAGYITPQARGPFYEVMDAANVDLKAFTEEFYQKLTLSHLQPVLDTLAWLKRETNVWFEITNLMIPRANDSRDEIGRMCDWIYDHLGPDVPLHFTAFHPDFRLNDRPHTPSETLFMAYDIATQRGLHYVYVGNVADVPRQTTYCPGCRQALIVRAGYDLHAYAIRHGKCQYCGTAVAGRYHDQPGTWGPRRQPVRIADFERQLGTSPTMQLGQTYTIQHRPAQTSSVPAVVPQPAAAISTFSSFSSQKATRMSDSLTAQTEFSADTKRKILEAAAEILTATTYGRAPEFSDPTLDGVADMPVYGCFVTAKRMGRLRGCCGVMSPQIPLGLALENSAKRTANDDRRFPPLSPLELPYLDLDVWLLFDPQPVTAKGEARRDAVQIGKHGLQIARGQNQGLLLPGVALEHGLDAERFLQHVCLKAGLPPHAWKDDDVALATFEGQVIEAPMPEHALRNPQSLPVKFTAADATALAQWFAGNTFNYLTGATPAPYAFNVTDGEANGVLIAVSSPANEVMHITKFALHESLPVQSTLLAMAQQTAQVLAGLQVTMEQLQSLRVDVTIFDDVAMHGTVAQADLRGIDQQSRAVLVNERNHLGVVYNRELDTFDAYEQAKELAGVLVRESAMVYSARVASTADRFQLTQKTTPMAGDPVRPAAVAGAFYPSDAEQLNTMVEGMLKGTRVKKQAYPAVMVPHAGLKFSGQIAADVLRRVKFPETVIVIGPKHTPHGVDWAIAPQEKWSIPGAEIENDLPLAQALVAAIPNLQFDAAAHAQEHAIEVELPFIAQLAPKSKVVGIAIGTGNFEKCQEFAKGLADVLREHAGKVLLVVSSDMNHYASDAENRRLDHMALGCIQESNAEQLYNTCRDHNISMCGLMPAVIVMETLKNLDKLQGVERIGYATSGDITGDKSRVVGYAGLVWE